ncbi:MAG TPA: hypothetical protein PKH58_10510 [Paludibacteraceae bacterium]|nr:hypothetical protein [Paludibacteraceae bacterium]
MKIQIPYFEKPEQKYAYLRQHKTTMLAMKKASIKHADGVCTSFYLPEKSIKQASKELVLPEKPETLNKIHIVPVINTTNILDSHNDVHINGIWNRSVNDTKRKRLLLQEHLMKFDHIISDEVSVSVKTVDWAYLGESYPGKTEALIYDCLAERQRNDYMFNNYVKGWVDAHSVGMLYIQLFLCMNSDSKYDVEEKNNWEKYYQLIVNKEMADNNGYFWAVTEAKEIEGSAVPIGSCPVTPTMIVEDAEGSEKSTLINAPEKSTHKNAYSLFNY